MCAVRCDAACICSSPQVLAMVSNQRRRCFCRGSAAGPKASPHLRKAPSSQRLPSSYLKCPARLGSCGPFGMGRLASVKQPVHDPLHIINHRPRRDPIPLHLLIRAIPYPIAANKQTSGWTYRLQRAAWPIWSRRCVTVEIHRPEIHAHVLSIQHLLLSIVDSLPITPCVGGHSI